MTVRLLTGDARAVMATLPAASVHCVITSPPYFALRDYGVAGQLGSEDHHDCLGWATGVPCGTCFVCGQVAVFRAVWRVLREDGTCWVNYGDTYASSGGIGAGGQQGVGARTKEMPRPVRPGQVRPKNLLGMPWRVALALQADGWILRRDIIWHKKTPMPETAKDRPTTAHEYLFLLVKQRYYHYDAAAIAEPVSGGAHPRAAQPPVGGQTRRAQKEAEAARHPGRAAARKALAVPAGWDTGKGGHRARTGRYTGAGRIKNNPSFDAAMGSGGYMPETRNKRSVWTLGPEPYKGAHFATFPTSLVEPCLLAGCPIDGTVLDPFGGSGTVGLVAQRHHRNAILIELNPATVELARARIAAEAPLLARIEVTHEQPSSPQPV